MKKLICLIMLIGGSVFADPNEKRTVIFKVEKSREVINGCIYNGTASYTAKVGKDLKTTERQYKAGTVEKCISKAQIACDVIKVIKEVEYPNSYLAFSGKCR